MTAPWRLAALLGLLAMLLAPARAADSLPQGRPMPPGLPLVLLPAAGLGPDDLAVVINDRDPRSRMTGEYYRQRRGIPPGNVVRVAFDPGLRRMPPEEFLALRRQVLEQTPASVQAYALAFSLPFRVGCMSVTSALALGYDERYCAVDCKPTAASPYFGAETRRPFADLGIRPAMLLAARDFWEAKALIDRGIAADGSWPQGAAYLLETSDTARNVRVAQYPAAEGAVGRLLPVRRLRADAIRDRRDVLFYFTGLARVADIYANTYLPGAMADHLTSFGGVLAGGSGQMSALEWLEAGATGSYGTVVEPCNFPGKFPAPAVAMDRYLRGKTLIEAYWGSVAMPGQGIFVGEPLAAPFGGYRVRREEGMVVISARSLAPGRYDVLASADGLPPFRVVRQGVEVRGYLQELRVPDQGDAVLRVVRAE